MPWSQTSWKTASCSLLSTLYRRWLSSEPHWLHVQHVMFNLACSTWISGQNTGFTGTDWRRARLGLTYDCWKQVVFRGSLATLSPRIKQTRGGQGRGITQRATLGPVLGVPPRPLHVGERVAPLSGRAENCGCYGFLPWNISDLPFPAAHILNNNTPPTSPPPFGFANIVLLIHLSVCNI